MGRDRAEGWSKGGCVGRKLMRDFLVLFQEQAAASQLDFSSPLLGLPGQQEDSETHGGHPGRQETTWLRGFAVVRAWAECVSMAGCRQGLPDMFQRWDTSLWAAFSAPTLDCSDMGHWKAATTEGLA